jgi:hypothetical protein
MVEMANMDEPAEEIFLKAIDYLSLNGKMTLALCFTMACVELVLSADMRSTSDPLSPVVGDSIMVCVAVSNTAAFAHWGISLCFDKTKLQLTRQSAGSCGTFVADSRPLSDINSSGEIHAGGYGWTNCLADAGILGSFIFQTTATGTAQIAGMNRTAGNPFGNALQPVSDAEFYPHLASQPLTIAILSNADNDNDGMADAWEIRWFGSTNAVKGGAAEDWDGDGQSNVREFLARTNPTDSNSLLEIKGAIRFADGMELQWPSVAGKSYTIEETDDMRQGFGQTAAQHLPATPPMNVYTVIVGQATSGYYRVKLEQ